MEEDIFVDELNIKGEEDDLEEAFNEIMDQEEMLNDEMIQDQIIKNEIPLDGINDILDKNVQKEGENNLTNGDLHLQNLVEKYTQIRKLGPKSRWHCFKSSFVRKKKVLLKDGDSVQSNTRKVGGIEKKVLKTKAKKEKSSGGSNSGITFNQAEEGKLLGLAASTELKQELLDFEEVTCELNPDTSISLDFDNMLYCDDCFRSYEGDCPEHGPLFVIEDASFSDDFEDKNRAEKTSPPQVSILNSEAESGVWARDPIPARTRFGPFEGKTVPPYVCTAYSWLIRKDGQPDHCVDATEPSLSNWMRYVNCARHKGQQNLHAFQCQGKIFYRTIRAIDPGEELLVWFGEEYSQQLGIDLQSGRKEAYTDMCPDCPYPCASPLYLLDHKKLSHQGLGMSNKTAKKAEELSRRNRRSSYRSAKSSTSDVRPTIDISEIDVNNIRPTLNPKTGERSYACPACKKFILRRSHLKRHLLIHSDVKPYFCQFCNKGFARKDNFDAHMKIRHAHEIVPVVTNPKRSSPGKETKPVEQMKERVSPRGHLTRRQQPVVGRNQFVCNKCDMRFSLASEVRAHMATHESDKPFGCDLCRKRFINKAGFMSHQKVVHKLALCPVKSQIFPVEFPVKSLRSAVKSQMSSVKSGVLPMKVQMPLVVKQNPKKPKKEKNSGLMCRVCGLRCRSEEHLTSHEHTHDDRFTICFVCNKKFSHLNHLKRHLLIHAGYRPHGCPHCGQDFSRTEHLKRHIRTHTRQGAFECGKCKKRFAKMTDFERHVRLHNKDAPCLQDQRLSMNFSLQRQLQSYINEENFNADDCDDIKQEVDEFEDEDEPLLNVFPEVILGAEN